MMRLIDADALAKEDICEHCTNKGASCEYMCNDNGYGEDAMWQMIDDAPTIDAVEVVRCNECLNSYKCCDGTLRCDNSYGPDNMDREVSASWFCANGERKDLSLGIKTIDKEVQE